MVRYRRSKKMGPFRITMSSRGISTSVGAGPFRITKGADGKVRRTIRVLGTGIYDTRVVSPAPPKSAGRKGQQNPMPPVPYPPPQLPPAGWYADPSGEASLRYWDGRQWTSATDTIPAALKQHNCPVVVGQERAVAAGLVRSWRLVIASLRDDGDASSRILDELEGCALCLKGMVRGFAAMYASVWLSMAQENKALAITEAEKQLANSVDEARPHV